VFRVVIGKPVLFLQSHRLSHFKIFNKFLFGGGGGGAFMAKVCVVQP
jgi:hypothetical protein